MITPAPGLGQEVGGYRLDDQLGEGGMGVVYRATHTLLGKKAAVKLMRVQLCADQESVRRFFNEAKLTASIRHPGIVEIFDYGVHSSGSAYIAMALLDGESLEDRLRSRGALSLASALRISAQIASALAAAHEAGVVHRDLKPDNVFLTPDPDMPGGERIRLLDFGIAKLLGDQDQSAALTQTGTVLGTPLYMSPEQCRGRSNLDGRTDLYALGCMLYQMLSGRPPFTGESALEVGAAHVRDDAQPIAELCPGIAAPLADLVHQLLAKEPGDRPATASVLVDRLADLLTTIETSPIGGRRPVASQPFPLSESAQSIELAETAFPSDDAETAKLGPDPKRRLRLIVAAAALLMLGGVATAWILARGDGLALLDGIDRRPCKADTATCRAFAEMLTRGEGVSVDRERARSLRTDACRQGDHDACIDLVVAERRSSIPLPEVPAIGDRIAPVSAVMALDFMTDESEALINRAIDLELKNRGDLKFSIAAITPTRKAELLATTACVFALSREFLFFLPMRDAMSRSPMTKVPSTKNFFEFANIPEEISARSIKECEKLVERQSAALSRHGVNENGTVFVAGKRLDPPYSNEAILALVKDTGKARSTGKGKLQMAREFVASSGVRFALPRKRAERGRVEIDFFCDPSRLICSSIASTFLSTEVDLGDGVSIEVWPISQGEPIRAVAGCVLSRFRLLEEHQNASLAIPAVDRRREPLALDALYGIARNAGISEDDIERVKGSCPAEIQENAETLTRLLGHSRPTTFVNGRPTPTGNVGGITGMRLEELRLAEVLEAQGLDKGAIASLLLAYDSQ